MNLADYGKSGRIFPFNINVKIFRHPAQVDRPTGRVFEIQPQNQAN